MFGLLCDSVEVGVGAGDWALESRINLKLIGVCADVGWLFDWVFEIVRNLRSCHSIFLAHRERPVFYLMITVAIRLLSDVVHNW